MIMSNYHVLMHLSHLESEPTLSYIRFLKTHLVQSMALISIAALVQQIDRLQGIEKGVSPKTALQSVGLTWSFTICFPVGKGPHWTQRCFMMLA